MHSKKTIALHIVIALVLLLIGIYVLIERQLLIAGKLTGHVYQFEFAASVVIAISFFLEVIFSLLVLHKGQQVKKINEIILIAALVFFAIGVFL